MATGKAIYHLEKTEKGKASVIVGFNYNLVHAKKSLRREVIAYMHEVEFSRGDPHDRFLVIGELPECEGVFARYTSPRARVGLCVFTSTAGYIMPGFSESPLCEFHLVKVCELVQSAPSAVHKPMNVSSIIITDLDEEDDDETLFVKPERLDPDAGIMDQMVNELHLAAYNKRIGRRRMKKQ